MKILLVAATKLEIGPFLNTRKSCDILITGVGMVATTYHLSGIDLKKRYDLVINAGIAGSFRKNIPIGTVAQVTCDCFSELGAEDGDDFLSLSDLNHLVSPDESPFSQSRLFNNNKVEDLKEVSGITVNTVHGNERSIEQVCKRWSPDIETMEGAAFFFVCLKGGVPCLQIRSISNYVERRNTKNWNIPLAIKTLNDFLISYIQ